MCAFMCVFKCAVVCMCRQEDNFNFYSLDVLYLPWFETGSFSALVFAKWSKMGDQQTPRPSHHIQLFFPKRFLWIELRSYCLIFTNWSVSPAVFRVSQVHICILFFPYLESARLLMSLKTGVIKHNLDTWLVHCHGLSAFRTCNIICYK